MHAPRSFATTKLKSRQEHRHNFATCRGRRSLPVVPTSQTHHLCVIQFFCSGPALHWHAGVHVFGLNACRFPHTAGIMLFCWESNLHVSWLYGYSLLSIASSIWLFESLSLPAQLRSLPRPAFPLHCSSRMVRSKLARTHDSGFIIQIMHRNEAAVISLRFIHALHLNHPWSRGKAMPYILSQLGSPNICAI